MKNINMINWDEWELRVNPKLPEILFTRDKVEYKCSDLRLLNESAIRTFGAIIQAIIEAEDVIDEIRFSTKGIDEVTVDIIKDVLFGLQFSARKKGRNGYECGGALLIDGVVQGDEEITFLIPTSRAKAIRKYGKSCNGKVDYFDLIVAIENESHLSDLGEALAKMSS